jgi:hypothetical protein
MSKNGTEATGTKLKGIVKLDTNHNVKYTTNSIVELEDTLGVSVTKMFGMLESGELGFKALRVFVWAGLIHQFENDDGTYDITLKEAGDIMDKHGIDKTIEKAKDALNATFPDVEPERPQANREQRRQGAKN